MDPSPVYNRDNVRVKVSSTGLQQPQLISCLTQRERERESRGWGQVLDLSPVYNRGNVRAKVSATRNTVVGVSVFVPNVAVVSLIYRQHFWVTA